MTETRRFLVGAALIVSLAACGEDKKDAEKAASPPPTPQMTADGTKAAERAVAAVFDRAKLVAAYDKGLDFLAGSQKDGVWSVRGQAVFQAGFTALAITPFLDRPGGMREGDRALAAKTLPWLVTQLGADGGIKADTSSNYETSVVIMALAASKDARYKADVDRAAKYLEALQYTDPNDPSYGGIGYGDDGPRSDMSNTQYALAALRAAGVPKDDPVYQKALAFLDRCQNRKENEKPGEPSKWTDKETGKTIVRGNDGGAVYFPGNGDHTGFDTAPDGTQVLKSYGSMTYALLRCYHLAGVDQKDGRVKAAVDWISKHWTVDANPGMQDGNDGLYYYFSAVGKTLPEMGVDRITLPDGKSVDWRAALGAKLLAEQKPNGMWMNGGKRWMEADPTLATGYALTALAACVR